MSFEDIYPKLSKYENLLNFLLVVFPETDIEGLSDEAAASNYIAGNVPIIQQLIIEEAEKLLHEPNPPWEEVAEAANRWFENNNKAKQWVEEIIQIVKKIDPREGMAYAEVLYKNDVVKGRAEYKTLFGFIFSEYLLHEYQKFSDNETARRYTLSKTAEQCDKVITQGMNLLSDNSFPWMQIDNGALNFKSPPTNFRKWLRNIIDIIKMSVEQGKE